MARLEELMHEHFVDYASYVILDRAIPDLRDGLKPVQRRILHTLFAMHDGRYHKVANVIGDTMKLHPHGDASIGDALVVLANKDYFIDRQGNFGNPLTGHPAAAARYIECRLTPLALDTLFNEALTDFAPSYDGRNQEPLCLPSKLPIALMLGTEGIAVGMATRILPHNLRELWQAQIALLEKKEIQLFPDFPSGGLMDVDAYEDGRGKVEVRARIEKRDERKLVISEIPFGTTTESLIASIEAAVQKGRLKIATIHDFSTDKAEIELTPTRGVDADEVLPQLYAYTDCAVSVSSQIVVVRDRRPEELAVTEVLQALTDRLKTLLELELQHERGQLEDRRHWLTLEAIFVEKRVYKRIEEAETEKAVRDGVWNGMHEHESLFARPMVEDDIRRLLEIRIRRISLYDIEKNRKEIKATEKRLKEIARKLENLTRTTIDYLKELLAKYGDDHPRRTEITRHEVVDKKAVARQNLKLAYDRETGFFGSAVRGEDFRLQVSEYDLVLAISNDGSYRVMPPVDKVLFSGRLIYCDVFDPEKGAEFLVVYRDKAKFAFAKRIKIEKFIRNREYKLIKDKAGKLDYLLGPETKGEVLMTLRPFPRQRVKNARFELEEVAATSPTARGTRLAPKPVSKVTIKPAKPAKRRSTAKAKPPSKAKTATPRKTAAPRKGGGDRGEQGSLF